MQAIKELKSLVSPHTCVSGDLLVQFLVIPFITPYSMSVYVALQAEGHYCAAQVRRGAGAGPGARQVCGQKDTKTENQD